MGTTLNKHQWHKRLIEMGIWLQIALSGIFFPACRRSAGHRFGGCDTARWKRVGFGDVCHFLVYSLVAKTVASW